MLAGGEPGPTGGVPLEAEGGPTGAPGPTNGDGEEPPPRKEGGLVIGGKDIRAAPVG